MPFAPLFQTQNDIVELSARDKDELLARLAAEAAARLDQPAETILEALHARESLGSTALGHGVALPHSRVEWLDSPFGVLARLERPVEFGARDGEPVDLVFLVLWPEANPEGFLPALSGICRALRDDALPRQLRRATTSEEALGMLQSADMA